MELVKFKNAEKIDSDTAVIFEYNLKDKNINICYCKINGRYPLNGVEINEKCKEIAFVVSGKGSVCISGKEYKIKSKDVVLIDKGESFYWEGNLKLALPCAPAWNINQCKNVIG